MTSVVIVGPPCAGKSTYAWAEREPDELVVDYDRIASSLGSATAYAAQGLISEAAFAARSEAIAVALASDARSWILHTSPTAEQISGYVEAGCDFLLVDPGEEECISRARSDFRPDGTEAVIRAWYQNPPALPSAARVSAFAGADYTRRGGRMNPFRPAGRNDVQRTPIRAEVPSAKTSGTTATLRLYDPIDSCGEYWGVSAKEFARVLDELPDTVTEIRLLINSPGGEVFEGIAIMNALRAHPARIVAIVEGIAASSASFIAAAADELVMMQNSQLYIHNAWGIVIGDAADLRAVADELEASFDRNIASVYAAKSGDTVDHWLAEMEKDRFLTAEEAVAEKLADRVEGVGDAEAAKARFDMSVFARSDGRRAAAHKSSTTELPSSSEPGEPNQKENVVAYDDLKAGLRERLGVTDAAAPDDVLLAAVDEALTEQADNTITPSVPEGTQLIDAGVLASLQADAAAGREARAQQDSERRDRVISDAIADGRIVPSSKAGFRAQLDKDEEGMTAVINSLPKNTVVPVAELGQSDDIRSDDDRAYAAIYGDTKES